MNIGDSVKLDDRNGEIKFTNDLKRIFNQNRTGIIFSVAGTKLPECDRSYCISFPAPTQRHKPIKVYEIPFQYLKLV